MRGVKHEFGMLFTHEGRLTRHIRAPKQQRQARASTGKLGRIGGEKKGFDGPVSSDALVAMQMAC